MLTTTTLVKPRLPLATARQVAERLVAQLAPCCERIEIAGSIRRGKADVADIELVAIPKLETRAKQGQLGLFGSSAMPAETVSLLDEQLEQMIGAMDFTIYRSRHALLLAYGEPATGEDVRRWGDRYKRFYLWANGEYGVLPVDLFITTADAWGAIFTIRTGPGDFSRELVTRLKYRTPYRQQDGALIESETGRVVPVPSEEDYFRLADVPYIKPKERSVATMRRVIWQAAQEAPQSKIVKALTIWQPWASLIAAGAKQYETRSWPTPYRGPLAIHAAKREPDTDYWDLLDSEVADTLPFPPPLGAVICVANLVDVIPTERLMAQPGFADSQEYDLGDYSAGRFAWKLKITQVFDSPLPVQGAQGLWNWEMATPVQVAPAPRFPSWGLGYTDGKIRLAIRARLEQRAGIGEWK